MSLDSLPKVARFVTTNNAQGKAVFSDAVGEAAEPKPIHGGEVVFGLQYCSEQFPVNLNENKDIEAYKKFSQQAPGLVINSGTVLRTVDMGPGHFSPMHRTVSLDYGIVLQGEVGLVLDSGETRRMKQGDVAIQRGTMHAWRNLSDTEPARMIYVLLPAQEMEVAGQKMGEDLADMNGVRSSS
ncbi:hypothetical protein LTR78_002697 [Recurvomyces mirabilis]|uniref:Cupin type-2 domain-containing protein n=1 Tax=Recurvomyces mirabilis TaxID=574656 RepID=A0AAE0WT68_9PEZI|nr:hypothetical protein LTR78_002697 [Recurvomyces mirabilis]KAK5159568.1 hypothetical protein LTS14_002710 [Recurvomyces mirabilis]